MKAITYRYKLKAKSQVLERRTSPELVLDEVSGSFINKVDGKISYKKFQYSLEVTILPKYFGVIREKEVFEIMFMTYRRLKHMRNAINC